jgi:hypothetical protein
LLDEPHDRSENIVTKDLRRAAAANGQTLEQTAANLVSSASRLVGRSTESEQAWPMSVSASGVRR